MKYLSILKTIMSWVFDMVFYILDGLLSFIVKWLFPILIFILIYLYNMPTVWSK